MVSIHTSPQITFTPRVIHPSFLRSILYTGLAILAIYTGIQALGVIPILIVAASVAAHEYGHYWGCKRFNIPVEEIRFTLLGGSVTQEHPAEDALNDAKIAALGPLFGLTPLIILYPLALITNIDVLITLCALLVVIHLVNCVPYGPLDGATIRDAITHTIGQSRLIPTLARRPLSWIVTIVQLVALVIIYSGFSYALSLI